MFQGKVWWITGASSGIGAALALKLGEQGASLILSGRNETALQAISRQIAGNSLVLPFEATDFERVPEIAQRARAWAREFGASVHGLINNAGISQRSLAVDTAFAVYQQIIAVDLLAPIALTQAVLPGMVAAGGGHIVAIASVAGIAGVPLRSAYCAAKHGLIGYHDTVRAETAGLGIKVLVVEPGSVRTNVAKNALGANGEARGLSDPAIENGMAPEEAARQIVEAIRAGKRELILAEGMEAEIVRLRRTDPNALFDMMARLVSEGYAQRMGVLARGTQEPHA